MTDFDNLGTVPFTEENFRKGLKFFKKCRKKQRRKENTERKIRSLMSSIICAVCNKPVKSFQVNEDMETIEMKFRVFCHGKSEEVKLHRMLLEQYVIEPGRAFEKKNLIENTN